MLYKVYLCDIHVTGLNISFSENYQKCFDHTGKNCIDIHLIEKIS